jgi:lipoteichoic acid synthase
VIPLRPRPLQALSSLAPLALALALLALPVLRALQVEAIFGPNADCDGCMLRSSLGHDAWLSALGLGLLAAAMFARRFVLRLAGLLATTALLLLMAADFAILSLLNARLYLLDVFKFGAEWQATLDFARALLRAHPVLLPAAAIAAAAVLLALLRPQPPQPRLGRSLAAVALLSTALALPLSLAAPTHVNGDAFLNLWQLHRDQGVSRNYSPGFITALAKRHRAPPMTCEAGQSRRPNVVLVLWESLSMYHSGLGTAESSLVPEFDAIARANTWFSAFHANGFTTDHGMIALLAGEYPVPQVGRYASLQAFAGFGQGERSIARQLRRSGYRSGFFTTGDLGFLDKPAWLGEVGFDHWEGTEHPFYAGLPRGPFAAADDDALYRRVLQWQREETASPYLAVLLTVESHPPFVHRGSGRLDESATFVDADRAFGAFYRALQADGFFEDGILIVLGDHRSMTPLRPQEQARYGESALALTPMLVAGASGLPAGEIRAPFQQTDLLPSLLQLVQDEACHRADQGRFLRPDPQPPSFVLHARGDQRSRIDLHHASGSGALLLRGDDSSWSGTLPPDAETIADFLHAERIRRGRLESDIPAILKLMGRE